jgi:hypothetical protein
MAPIKCSEIDRHVMWSLKFGDFTDDFVRYNLDNN